MISADFSFQQVSILRVSVVPVPFLLSTFPLHPPPHPVTSHARILVHSFGEQRQISTLPNPGSLNLAAQTEVSSDHILWREGVNSLGQMPGLLPDLQVFECYF